jgi:hypothetical protein
MNIDNLKIKGSDINDNYFKNILFPFFENLKNVILSDKDLKKIETILFGSGKGTSVLYNFLILDKQKVTVQILDCLTERHLLTEKFVFKIITIMEFYKRRAYNINLDFNWLYNLNYLGFNFSDELLEELKKIGFIPEYNMNEKINKQDIEIQELFQFKKVIRELDNKTDFKNIKSQINKIIKYMKDSKIIPNKYIISMLYKQIKFILDTNISIEINDYMLTFIKDIYTQFVKNKYQLTEYDLEMYLDLYVESIHCYYRYDDHELNRFEKDYIEILNFFTIDTTLITENIINNFIDKFIKGKIEFPNNVGLMYLIQVLLEKNKSCKLSLKKLISLETCYYFADDLNDYNFDEFINTNYNAKTYQTLINYVYDNKLDTFDDDYIELCVINNDAVVFKLLCDKNIIVPSTYLMNLACSTSSIYVIDKFLSLKYIPTYENLTYCDDNIEIYDKLIENGLPIDDRVLEYFISKHIDIIDLIVYDYNTEDKLPIVEDLCYKYNKFPYPTIKPSKEFTEIVELISNNASTCESIRYFNDNIGLFDTENKKMYLLNKVYSDSLGMYFLKYMYKKYNLKANMKKEYDSLRIAYY